MNDTLVLSTSFQPIGNISWRKAFGLLFSGKVEVVKYHDNRFVRTVSETLNVPSIIRFVKDVFSNSKKKLGPAKYNRSNVFIRDKGKCQYCNKVLSKTSFTLDHVIPVSQGGQSKWQNVVVCCHPCNRHKDNMTPEQAGMRLMNKPYVPTNKEIESQLPHNEINQLLWREYLQEMVEQV